MAETEHRAEPDELRLAAWRAFLNAHAAVVRAIERDMAAAGALPLGWYDVLVALAEAPGGRRRLHELADAVVLSRSGLTRLVDRLEAAGLLVRERSTDDKRGAYAVLTDAGRAAQLGSWPAYGRAIRDHFARHLGDEEAGAIIAGLERVYDATLAAERAGRRAGHRP